ncbi:hypothetical protein GZ22_18530 (plasmid) [Terribacillus saccharophilus]|uniref:Uncharacterized protein n=1 Tax=Terribacillus saccharophilus TaxID=361277 RepID=A0A075LQZ7_9BACI|nr:hypothetical protein [Terribacillus goriensis]AIF68422.1 hypothetical protein GZ22_18530 [Terribacillus goriensis]
MYQEYKVPNRKKWLLTDDFLLTLKNEIAKATKDDLDGKNYWNYYAHIEGRVIFDGALKEASKKHNVLKAIYEYTHSIDWYKSETFEGYIFERMMERNIIEEGDAAEYTSMYDESMEELEKNGEIQVTEEVRHHNGYSVKVNNWEFTNKFKSE